MSIRFKRGQGQSQVEDYLSRQYDSPFRKQGAPAAKTTATVLTAAELMGRIIVGTPGAAVSYQLPIGTNIEIALKAAVGRDLENDDSFDFSVINVDATGANAITLTTNTGLTLVGDMTMAGVTVGDGSSGRFTARRTAMNVYTIYRIS